MELIKPVMPYLEKKLRSFLRDNVAIEAVVDFGDMQIFEGVATYPAIVTLRKGEAKDGDVLTFSRSAMIFRKTSRLKYQRPAGRTTESYQCPAGGR
jgi:hypothetical protein